MERNPNHPSLSSQTGDKILTDEVRSHPVHRNQSCVRALMFGKAPLSITEKMNENNIDRDNILEFHKSAQSLSSLKRKRYDEEHDVVNLENFSPSVKTRKITEVTDVMKNSLQIMKSPESVEFNRVRRTLDEADACAAPEKVSIDNPGFNFHNTLQADWTLPCFKTAENHLSPRMTFHKTQSELNQSQVNQNGGPQNGNFDGSQNGHFSQNKDSKKTTDGIKPINNGDMASSDWCSPNRTTSHMNDHDQSVNAEQYRTNFVNQQQLFQSLQLDGCHGELMLLPPIEMHKNGPLIVLQQTHIPSNVKFLQPSTDIPNQNGQSLPSTLNKVISQCPRGSASSLPHISQRQNSIQLNSSGEEMDSQIMDRSAEELSPQRTPYPSTLQKQVEQAKHSMCIDSPLFGASDENDPSRQQHNHKERIRRARIRDACHLLRQLVPGMSDKTDKATVFEFAARYVHFLRAFVGEQYDKDFLMKYSPY